MELEHSRYSESETEAAIRAGQLLSFARKPLINHDGLTPQASEAGTPYVLLPEGSNVHSLEDLLPIPARKRGTTVVSRPESFVAYLDRHAEDPGSMIYADVDSEKSHLELVCIINDHGLIDPGWRDHRCHLSPALSVEWKRWLGKDRKQMKQAEFASWIEDNRGDVASVEGMPTGAQMLEMALNFEAAADKRFKSRVGLRSGSQTFEFVDREDDQTHTRMEVFDKFMLGLPVFYGAATGWPIVARLRYRAENGALVFWYELVRTDRVFQQAADEIIGTIAEKSRIVVIYGSPEK